MKKLLIAMFVLCLGVSMVAGTAKVKAAPVVEEYNAMDLGFWFGFPASMETANVRGWRLGLTISYGNGYVCGAETALLCGATDSIEGLQSALGWCETEELSGLQAAICANICNNEAKGAQISLVNVAGKSGWQIGLVNSSNNAKFQCGLINLNKGGLFPFSILFNFGKDTFRSSETIVTEAAKSEKKKK